MFILFSFSLSTWILLVFFILCVYLILTENSRSPSNKDRKDEHKIRNGPRSYWLIGSLPYLAKFNNPVDTFTNLAKDFGDVVPFKMGMVDSILLSGYENIRQILVSRQHEFDSRVDFQRYGILFHSKENAVAFANYSEIQKKRRELIHSHTFPKMASFKFEKLDSVSGVFLNELLGSVHEKCTTEVQNGGQIYIKPLLLDVIGKIFFKFFCNLDITQENVVEYQQVVIAFDLIFQDINKGCIGDLFPFLMRFYSNRKVITEAPAIIRKFIEKHCIDPRVELRKTQNRKRARKSVSEVNLSLAIQSVTTGRKGLVRRTSRSVSDLESLDENNNSFNKGSQFTATDDLLDAFLDAIELIPDMTNDLAFYGMEDILGGHSAVANFMTKAFVLFARYPEVQVKIREEVDQVLGLGETVTLQHRLPYTEAALLEATRFISSQIVPHSPNKDTFIDDIPVKKGSAIFFNIHDLNFSPKHWTEPNKFMPERFLVEDLHGVTRVVKPEYFLPFGVGKRTCLGYKIANWIGFLISANLFQHFTFSLDPTEKYSAMDSEDKGCLSSCSEGYRLVVTPNSPN